MKIIATDYDGTLNHNGIDDKKRSAIMEWRRAGNLFGVVSGRGIKSLLEVIEGKDFEYDFLIANNGAIIFDKELNVLAETRCDGACAVPLITDLFSWGCTFANIDKDIPVPLLLTLIRIYLYRFVQIKMNVMKGNVLLKRCPRLHILIR